MNVVEVVNRRDKMVLNQCFIIIVAFSFSSATTCTDANGYVYSASKDENGEFTASFCRSGVIDTVVISNTTAVYSCNALSSCIGENFGLYTPRTGISISSAATSEIFQYCDWLNAPGCSACYSNEACTITMITGLVLPISNGASGMNTLAMYSSTLQMDFF